MVKAKTALLLNVCFLSFYITALKVDAGACEVDCLKIIWNMMLVITSIGVLFSLNRAIAIFVIGNYEISLHATFFWHRSKVLALFFILCWLGALVINAMLFYNIVSISDVCKKEVKLYGIIWKAAEFEGWFFITTSGVIVLAVIILFTAMVLAEVYGINFGELLSSDVENPAPVPISQETDLTAVGEIKSKNLSVQKTDEEEKACSICMENEKTHACIPCGHMCLCALCAEDLSKRAEQTQTNAKCPVCRFQVDNFSRIYQ